MKKHLLMIAIASTCCLVAGQASAMTQDEYKVAKEKIEADYKVDKKQCDTLKDNAKDVCHKEAKGKEAVAKAELEQQYKPSDKHARDVQEEKIKANYEVAKEKCDDLKGDSKSACEKQAKADQDRGKAELRAMK
ncbi:MAG: hypothetical protein J7605_15475 [Variovorax sp.]|nr:hypothetical protein [Variovorax sp.]